MAHLGDGAWAYGGPIPTTLPRSVAVAPPGGVVTDLQPDPYAVATLGDLLDDVMRARGAIHRVRRVPVTSRPDVGHARHELVLALEAYTSCLMALGKPVPYGLRDELRLQRGLDAVS